jgi:hypothetical protein
VRSLSALYVEACWGRKSSECINVNLFSIFRAGLSSFFLFYKEILVRKVHHVCSPQSPKSFSRFALSHAVCNRVLVQTHPDIKWTPWRFLRGDTYPFQNQRQSKWCLREMGAGRPLPFQYGAEWNHVLIGSLGFSFLCNTWPHQQINSPPGKDFRN